MALRPGVSVVNYSDLSLPPPLINDLTPSPPPASPSASPLAATSSPATVERYTPRDPMSFFELFNLTGVRALITPIFMLMMLNHTSV